MELSFYKYQGAGNDFVVIDNRKKVFEAHNYTLIRQLCDRRFGIGGDGLMLLELEEGYDFRMLYFNSDGYEASMCGNGGRCIAAFARFLGIIDSQTRFIATDGEHRAIIDEQDQVDLQLTEVDSVELFDDGYFLNTGVPHFVIFTDDLSGIDVNREGRVIRYDPRFQPAGTNVNFVRQSGMHLTVYTYERGVEAETLACGTGITASALSAAYKAGLQNGMFGISAKGGELSVRFKKTGDRFTDVWLKGPAQLVFEGKICV